MFPDLVKNINDINKKYILIADGCGKEDKFLIENLIGGQPNTDDSVFQIGYTGPNFRVFVSPTITGGKFAIPKVSFAFPSKKENDVSFTDVVRNTGGILSFHLFFNLCIKKTFWKQKLPKLNTFTSFLTI